MDELQDITASDPTGDPKILTYITSKLPSTLNVGYVPTVCVRPENVQFVQFDSIFNQNCIYRNKFSDFLGFIYYSSLSLFFGKKK